MRLPAVPLADIDFTPFWHTVMDWGRAFSARLPYIIAGLVVIFAFVIVGRLVRRGIVAAGKRSRLDSAQSAMLARVAGMLVVLLGVLIAAVVVFPSFAAGDLITGLGITSIAVGFALKDILQNFFAGILLLWQRPFRVGDQVRIKDFEGTIEEINIRSTQLHTYDGERIVIPNSDVYTNAVIVRTAYDRRRLQLRVGIKATEAIDRARDAIRNAVGNIAVAEPAPDVRVDSFTAGSVNLAIGIWVKPDYQSAVTAADATFAAIKRALEEAGIALA
jgi:small-conductance mechanosensitive channel